MPKGQSSSKKEEKAVTKSQVKQMIKSTLKDVQELKIFIVQTSASVDYGGTIVDMSSIAQGDSDITRDGDRIQVVEWSFRWVAYVGDVTNLFRVILFQYVPDSALGTPLVSYVIQTTGSTNSPISYRSIDYVKNVKILYDRTVSLDTYHPAVQSTPVTIKKFYDKQMQFTGATSRTNGLFMLVISDLAAATHPSISYYSTIRFTDS